MTVRVTGSSESLVSPHRLTRSPIGPEPFFGTPPPRATRSFINVVTATAQPLPTSPNTRSWGIRTSVRKISLNSASPVIWCRGRTSTPSDSMSSKKYVRPLCLGWSGSVRATSIPHRDTWASVVQTFWPLTIHSSPSRTARLDRPATSEPEPGSLKSWHQTSSPVYIGRRRRCFCSSDA